MKTKISLLLLLLSQCIFGCTHLESLSTSAVPADRRNPVRAETSRFIVLALNFDNDYVNTLTEDMARQCPRGQVKGILTKHESIVYFPLFFHKVRVSAQGYCVSMNGRRDRQKARQMRRRGRGVSSEQPAALEDPYEAEPTPAEEQAQ